MALVKASDGWFYPFGRDFDASVQDEGVDLSGSGRTAVEDIAILVCPSDTITPGGDVRVIVFAGGYNGNVPVADLLAGNRNQPGDHHEDLAEALASLKKLREAVDKEIAWFAKQLKRGCDHDASRRRV